MSTGAAYQLLVNTGSQDKLLLATDLLNSRLNFIRDKRCRDPNIADPTPTLTDIEQTHLLFLHAHYKPFVATAYEYMRSPVTAGVPNFGTEITFSIPQFGDFFNDMIVNFTLSSFSDNNPAGLARYCDFPGHRIIKRARFEVNSNFLDEYDSHTYNMHYNFRVSSARRKSWLRCIGQEIPKPLYVDTVPGFREVKYICNGPQTPKNVQPPLELFVPLIFWFNEDPRLSIPSAAIPYGQRFIKLLLCNVDELCYSSISPNYPQITNCEIIINNIFVNEEIHNIFIKRVGFSIIRVHRIQRVNNITPVSGSIKLDELKYPIELIYIGILPEINEAVPNNMTDWYKYYYIDNQPVPTTVAYINPLPPPTYSVGVGVTSLQIPRRSLTSIAFQSHGIDIYKEFKSDFYDNVINYIFGSETFNSAEEFGIYLINFSIYTGTYQPTGYFNTSQTRENYFNYQSTSITVGQPASLIMVAVAINFLLIGNDTAILRYYL